MFWVPVMFVAACLLFVRYSFHSFSEAARVAKENKWKKQYETFAESVKPSRELQYKVHKDLDNANARICAIQELVGNTSEDWASFAIQSQEAAQIAAFAKLGKIESPISGFTAMSVHLDPPWKAVELTERFMLLVEEELQRNGVETQIVANYGNSHYGNYTFYPVREYVKKYGFARKGYADCTTRFEWKQCTPHQIEDVV